MKLDDTILLSAEQQELIAQSEKPMELHSRSRIAQIVSLIICVLTGTFTGVAGGFAFAVYGMVNTLNLTHDQIEFYQQHYVSNLAEFTTKNAKADFLSQSVIVIGIAAAISVVALIVYAVNTVRLARGEDRSYNVNFWDRIWSEAQLIIMAACFGMALSIVEPIRCLASVSKWIDIMRPLEIDKYYYGIDNRVVLALCILGLVACLAITAICFATLIKKIAAKSIIKDSLLGKLLVYLGIGVKFAGHGATVAARGLAGRTRQLGIPAEADAHATAKLMIKYVLIFAAIITLPEFLFVAMGWNYNVLFFAWPVSIILATLIIYRKIRKFAEIRAGVIAVKSGDLSYKINVVEDANGPKTDLDKLASDINHISEATNIAVQNEIKNQRMKTDLISNVSHDLKTPLTSMISYLDILEKEGLDSPDAPAHLAIVQEKTERLKTLTEELFEAAKASSGNIACEITNIDLNALIDQSLAEMGDRLAMKNLKIRKKIQTEDTMIRADGKLMYRILENLLGNISKYALEGSRVYIDVSKPDEYKDKLLLEVKNISKEELNITEEELMERFTRGDSSRNTEGSGLGLAIAKDLAKIMGGEFSISIDGDMFKASVLLNV